MRKCYNYCFAVTTFTRNPFSVNDIFDELDSQNNNIATLLWKVSSDYDFWELALLIGKPLHTLYPRRNIDLTSPRNRRYNHVWKLANHHWTCDTIVAKISVGLFRVNVVDLRSLWGVDNIAPRTFETLSLFNRQTIRNKF